MIKDKYVCKDCKRVFCEPQFYKERHGLDSEPYERVAVCPYCNSGNFYKFNAEVEKLEVAEKILPAITHLNKYINSLKNLFGACAQNSDLSDGLGLIAELISEMFDYIPINIERKIFEMDTEKECEKILFYLKGEL